jgi:very-short-patch-repair endonuclease
MKDRNLHINCSFNKEVVEKRTKTLKKVMRYYFDTKQIGKHISESKKGKQTGENNPNYGHHLSEEVRKKISDKSKLYWEKVKSDPEKREMIRKRNSQIMRTRNLTNNPMWDLHIKEKAKKAIKKTFLEFPERHPNYVMGQKGFVSSLERKMVEILDSLYLKYVRQYPVRVFAKSRPRFIDLAIPDRKIGIECDGGYWHNDEQRDAKRDWEILSVLPSGWIIYHFSEKEIENLHNKMSSLKNLFDILSEGRLLISLNGGR